MKFSFGSKFRYDDEVADKIYKEILFKAMLNIQNKSKKKCPENVGDLRRSIKLKPINPNASEYFVFSNLGYAAPMEYGTVPYYAPINPLKEWAKKKLGDEDVGYAIQAKIAKEGINAHPFFRPALDETINADLDKIGRQVKEKYS